MEFNALKKIGYTLRFHRRRMELSQNQMAEALGISSRNLQRIEAGEVEPKLETLICISKVLDIPVSSLIRPTDTNVLSIQEVATSEELDIFQELHRGNVATGEDLSLAEQMIANDRTLRPSATLQAQLHGTVATCSEKLSELIGIKEQKIDIHPYVVFGTAAERWEFVFRHGLRQAVIENAYLFPNGIKVFQEYHYNLNPNPDRPTSEIYIRDITENYNLSVWLKQMKTKRALP